MHLKRNVAVVWYLIVFSFQNDSYRIEVSSLLFSTEDGIGNNQYMKFIP
jgi:hypothetical protein